MTPHRSTRRRIRRSTPRAALKAFQNKALSDGQFRMQKAVVVLAIILLTSSESVHAQQAQAGRYQMVTAPASQSQSLPELFLLKMGISFTPVNLISSSWRDRQSNCKARGRPQSPAGRACGTATREHLSVAG